MSVTYTGVPGNVNPASAVDITEPQDGDALNVASVNVGLSELTDYAAFFKQWVTGLAGDTGAIFKSTTTPTINKLIAEWNINGTVKARVYACNGYFLGLARTINARYTGTVGQEWDTDANSPSVMVVDDTAGVLHYGHPATAVGVYWTNTDWVASQNLARAGALTTAGAILATNAAITAGTTLTAGVGVTATTGDVTASAGNVVAAGTVVGSAGPGLVKAERFYSTGTAMTNGQFASLTNWGSGGSVTSTYGTDAGGFVVITADGGAPAPAADPSFVFTFKDGTFTNAPAFLCQFAFTDDATITVANSSVEITNVSATTATITLRTAGVAPTATKSFRFHWHAIGV
jgi:hypothetical protein